MVASLCAYIYILCIKIIRITHIWYNIYIYIYTFDSQNSLTWNPSDGHFQTPKMTQKPAPTRDMPTPSIVNGVHGAPLFWLRFTSFLSILHLQSFHHVHHQRLQSLLACRRWMARIGPLGHAPSSLVVIDFPGFRAASSPSYAWKAPRPNIAALGHDKTCVVFL